MGEIERAVLRGDWYRDRRVLHVFLRVAADSSVQVTVKASGSHVVMGLDGTLTEVPYVPFHYALSRMVYDDSADVVLYETDMSSLGADCLVGLVPAPGVRSVAWVTVRLRPGGQSSRAEETHELVVRPTDAFVPLWRGTFVPAVNGAFQLGSVEVTPGGGIPAGHEPRLVAAMLRAELRHWLARAHLVVPSDCSVSPPSLQTQAGVATVSAEVEAVRLPDLRGALLDQGSEARTRERTRVIFQELMAAAWRPDRALARSMAMLDS